MWVFTVFVSSLVLIKRTAASGTNNYFRKRQKNRHGTAKKRAGSTYTDGLGTPKMLGTGAHHLSIYTAKIEGAVG